MSSHVHHVPRDRPAPSVVATAGALEARNLTDAVYSPTFSVDDAAGRYFQPADGRSLYAGVRGRP